MRAAICPCSRSSDGTGALLFGLASCLRTGRSALTDPAETTPAPANAPFQPFESRLPDEEIDLDLGLDLIRNFGAVFEGWERSVGWGGCSSRGGYEGAAACPQAACQPE